MKRIVSILLVLTSISVQGQFTETLTSDRPGQALSSNTVGKNVFQIQAGLDFLDNATNFYPNSYFRYGLSERFEVNSGFVLPDNKLENVLIGVRYALNASRSKFKSALQYSFDVGPNQSNSQLIYSLGSSFSDNFSYTLNVGFNFRKDFSVNNGIYVINLSYAITNKIGVFIEPFGSFLNGNLQSNIDSGFYYLLNNNLQIDALFGENNGFFAGVGLTWRILTKSK